MSFGGRVRFLTILALVATVCSAARAVTPEQLFAADASGMVQITAHCANGVQHGSGFLLGPRVVMTARHVLVDARGRPCSAMVVQQGTGRAARVSRWMAIAVKPSNAPADLAIATLDTPLTGHDFSISAASPTVGQLVVALGYALEQPLSLNQGHVISRPTAPGVRLLEMSLLEAGGASGGPILNASGRVIGITQFGGLGGLTESVDLAHLDDGAAAQLCFGFIAAQRSTLCSSGHPKPGSTVLGWGGSV